MICWIISLEKNWSRCLRALSLSERTNCSEDPICCFFDLWICNLNIHGIFNKSFWGFSDRFMSGLLRFHDYRSFFYELGEKKPTGIYLKHWWPMYHKQCKGMLITYCKLWSTYLYLEWDCDFPRKLILLSISR